MTPTDEDAIVSDELHFYIDNPIVINIDGNTPSKFIVETQENTSDDSKFEFTYAVVQDSMVVTSHSVKVTKEIDGEQKEITIWRDSVHVTKATYVVSATRMTQDQAEPVPAVGTMKVNVIDEKRVSFMDNGEVLGEPVEEDTETNHTIDIIDDTELREI